MSSVKSYVELEISISITFIFCIIGFILGIVFVRTTSRIDIQEIKQIDTGYYVTINNEIYYKEVENEK